MEGTFPGEQVSFRPSTTSEYQRRRKTCADIRKWCWAGLKPDFYVGNFFHFLKPEVVSFLEDFLIEGVFYRIFYFFKGGWRAVLKINKLDYINAVGRGYRFAYLPLFQVSRALDRKRGEFAAFYVS